MGPLMNIGLKMLSIIAIAGIFALPQQIFAANCQPIYGGGETCTTAPLGIAITVLNPATNTFVHTLGTTDPAYKAGNSITFQIKATNNTNQPISQLTITNTLPEFVNYSTSPGKYNPNTRQLTFIGNNVAANQEQKFTIVGRIAAENQLPANQSLVCRNSQVTATTTDGKTAQDTAQFCIQTTGGSVTGGLHITPPSHLNTTPPTGPDMFSIFSLISIEIVGICVRKCASVFFQRTR